MLAGVWGRRFERAQQVAGQMDVTAYDDVGALLDDVDAVAFAVPPDVQATLATRAARAGKHLLLDKPIATTVAASNHASLAMLRRVGPTTVTDLDDRQHRALEPARRVLAEHR